MKNSIMRAMRRKKYVIRPKFQVMLLILSYSYVLFFCAFMGAYLFVPLMREMDKSVTGSDELLIAAKRILYLNERFWPGLLFSFLVIGVHSIYISHKIAGPLYRFNLIFKAIKEGTIPLPDQIRKNDYLYGEMENINQMLGPLREKLTDLQETQTRLNRSIIACKDTVGHSSTSELIKKIEDLAEQGKKLGEKLGYFKVIT